jgi:hypothetical protein
MRAEVTVRARLALASLLALGCFDPATGDPTDTDTAAGDTPTPSACAAAGLPERAWEEAASDATLGALAADVSFDVTTVADRAQATVQLSTVTSGCDTLLFLPDAPAQNRGFTRPFWDDEDDLKELFQLLPDNVQVFFVSMEDDRAARRAITEAMVDRVAKVLRKMSTEKEATFAPRVHVVDRAGDALPGWLGEALDSPGWGVLVDREQRVRYVGSFADPARYDNAAGWFAPNLAMAANEAVYSDFVAARNTRLAADGATVIRAFDAQEINDSGWAGVRGVATVTLPDAATMQGFDTLELDLTLDCIGEGEYGTCPAWDYLVYAYLCAPEDGDTCSIELGRWITTYHREGRWVHDITPLLPLLDAGGAQRIQFYTIQPYAVTLDLRLRDQGRGERPVAAYPLFMTNGATLDAAFNEREPVVVPIPADAARVELTTVLTGHGMAEVGNCAEFCTIDNIFSVNGTAHTLRFEEPGDQRGCMAQVGQGTVPNQYGTWWYGRNGWCPGKQVDVGRLDVTADVTPGQDASFDYEALYQGAPHPGGATQATSSWAVIWR